MAGKLGKYELNGEAVDRRTYLMGVGKCTRCGLVDVVGIQQCDECRAKQSRSFRRWYERMRAMDLCTNCGKGDARGATLCEPCHVKKVVGPKREVR